MRVPPLEIAEIRDVNLRLKLPGGIDVAALLFLLPLFFIPSWTALAVCGGVIVVFGIAGHFKYNMDMMWRVVRTFLVGNVRTIFYPYED